MNTFYRIYVGSIFHLKLLSGCRCLGFMPDAGTTFRSRIPRWDTPTTWVSPLSDWNTQQSWEAALVQQNGDYILGSLFHHFSSMFYYSIPRLESVSWDYVTNQVLYWDFPLSQKLISEVMKYTFVNSCQENPNPPACNKLVKKKKKKIIEV